MYFLKTKLFLFAVLIAIAATFYYFGDTKKLVDTILSYVEKTPLKSVVEKSGGIDTQNVSQDLQQGVQDAENSFSQLSQRTQEVSKHVGNVLGSSVEATNSTPLHEKALEYGQYIYCKQVVSEYETVHPEK